MKKIWLEEWKTLVELLIYEADRFWSRFNILLGLNSALIVAINYLISQGFTLPLYYTLLMICALGIISSIIWAFHTATGGMWQRYWLSRLRELEKEKLNQLSTFTCTGEYIDKRKWYEKVSITKSTRWMPLSFIIISCRSVAG